MLDRPTASASVTERSRSTRVQANRRAPETWLIHWQGADITPSCRDAVLQTCKG